VVAVRDPTSPNASTPTSTVIRRWGAFSVIAGFGVVYLMMVSIGFAWRDAVWIAGMSVVPLGVALLVAVWVWRSYWKLD